jgi:EamA-like transporter family
MGPAGLVRNTGPRPPCGPDQARRPAPRLGLFPTTLGFTTWAYALARTTAGRMGATIYAVPVLVIVMSWLILGQVPRWLAVVGGVFCLAGVAVSRSRLLRSRGGGRESNPPALQRSAHQF